MNKNKLSTEELHEMIVDASLNTNGAFDHIIKYEVSDFWDNFAEMEYEPQDIADIVFYGDYRPSDDVIGFNGNGNLESMAEEDYRKDLLYYFEEYYQEV